MKSPNGLPIITYYKTYLDKRNAQETGMILGHKELNINLNITPFQHHWALG